MFDITFDRIAGIPIICLHGSLVFGQPVDTFRAVVRELIGNAQRRVVLDLSGVTRIDSSGLGALVQLHMDLERERGTVVLAGLSGRIRSLLDATRVLAVLRFADTERAAVELLTSNRLALRPETWN